MRSATIGRTARRADPAILPKRPTLSFLGAASTGTGERFLIEAPEARVLVDGGLFQDLKRLRLRNREPFAAEVVHIDAFSSHADSNELLEWHRSTTRPPDQTYVVHGEPASAAALRDALDTRLHRLAVVARDRERVRLDT
jgi:metallo-beta-lactamase family protein